MADEPKYEDGREYDTGDMIGDFEVTAVSYQERELEDGSVEKYNFTYHTQNPKDIVKEPEHGQELTTEDVQASQQAISDEHAQRIEDAKSEAENADEQPETPGQS